MRVVATLIAADVPGLVAMKSGMDDGSTCLQSSRVGLEALRYFGVHAEPKIVRAIAGNEPWLDWMFELDWQPGPGKKPMPEEAWAVGVDPEYKPGERRFPGHMVLLVGDGLLDLSSGQLSRPERGMRVSPTVWTPLLEEARRPLLAIVELDDNGALIYGEDPEPARYVEATAWRTTATWSGPIIRWMKSVLE